ncbi:FAD:protein FMN transferase [Shewanella sp. VB17]|uniref:FAD:protein FMN transferase n=1 Tax=Shewanella sp. VB17 TaxID=2739432 RepID=UPI001563508A|nr:FAD:protein FMN transferase [Shewanella sp. VB17]NRD73435.1 FAD:protein FMN transferase [Shewanella sp. VB17]
MSSDAGYHYRFTAMTVPCEIILFADAAQLLAVTIENNTRRLEAKYNFHDKRSWLTQQVNDRQVNKVKLDDETAAILACVRQYCIATEGVFDMTIGSLKYQQISQSTQSREQLYLDLAPYMGLANWSIDGNWLNFCHYQTRFDLGGVIKECAVDQAVDLAKSAGATGVLINFGGDIRTFGHKPDGSAFIVAVVNPKDNQQAFFSLPLNNQALTTSAHYQRRYQFNDEQTSHILSKDGVHPQILSSTVVADTALEAGIYSTALTIKPTLDVPETVGFAFIDDTLTLHQDVEFIQL